ncbi:hypothetical protein ACIPJ1_10825 [Microbacterium maritypicum]|uniref:hypothetical protein n=1 Tax=Microbacterium maritypicum TaxID=33918 RepID=UPI00382FB4FF
MRIKLGRVAAKTILDLFSTLSKRPTSDAAVSRGTETTADISAALAELEESGIVIQVEAAGAGTYTTSEPPRPLSRRKRLNR